MLDLLTQFVMLAHVLPGDVGAIEGFLHPLLGLNHLLAMVAVGLLSAQIGGRAVWTVPVAFVLMMAVGAVIGFLGLDVPLVDVGIAASVVLLGIAIVAQSRIPELVALVIVGIFGALHGYAHGAEVPTDQTIIFFLAYVVGFISATAGLHVIGALIGYIALRSDRGTLTLRVTGAVIALLGVSILLGIL